MIQIAALVGLFVRSPVHRWPATIIIIALVGNRAIYTIKAADHPLGEYLPSEVLLVGVASLAFAVALFGFRILNPVAQAQWTAIAQMSDGMVVLDTEGRVASINPAAQEILGVSARKVLGQPLQSQLLGQSNLVAVLTTAGAKPADVAVGTGPAARYVLLRISVSRTGAGWPAAGCCYARRDPGAAGAVADRRAGALTRNPPRARAPRPRVA